METSNNNNSNDYYIRRIMDDGDETGRVLW